MPKAARACVSVVAILLLALMLSVDTMQVHAPELFGDGTMVYVRTGDYLLGYIHAWGGWVIYGRQSSCQLVQVLGAPIDGAAQGVPCHINPEFTGWINFRGHERPFCGSTPAEQLPGKCRGE